MTGSPPARRVTARLRQASGLADLRPAHRLDAKLGLDAAAATRRLRQASALRELCVRLGRPGQAGAAASGGPGSGEVTG